MMEEDGEEYKGSVRRLTKEELAELKLRWEQGTPIEPDENGNYKIPFRVKIDLSEWRGFVGTTINIIDNND